MKVRELTNKAHLISGQYIKLHDRSTASTFITVDRYTFFLDSDEVERLLELNVDRFSCDTGGLTIWAE